MKVTFLGTGTSMGVPLINCACKVCHSKDPKDNRLRSSIKIETNGHTFLVDASPDFRQQSLKFNIPVIDGIFVTHPHADHILGLEDTRIFSLRNNQPVHIYSNRYTLDSIKRIFWYAFEEEFNHIMPKPYFRLHNIEKPMKLFGHTMTPVSAMHGKMPVLGFRFDNFLYLTDFSFISDHEIEKLNGVKTAVIGALRYTPSISHLTIEKAVDFAERLQADTTFFTHFSHEILHSEIEKTLPDGIFPAFDGLTLNIE